jgi:adenosylmethionine-8-amino-7-oxononanoate aminotransferase
MSNFDTEIQKLDTAHYIHPFTDHKALGEKGARVMVRGEGIYCGIRKARRSSTACPACGA